jgi:hypothetical protein
MHPAYNWLIAVPVFALCATGRPLITWAEGLLNEGCVDNPVSYDPLNRRSPTLHAIAPERAIVLFDGNHLNEWVSQKAKSWEESDGPADWKILPSGELEVVPSAGCLISKRRFRDFQMHLEFRLPPGNVNGGLYLQTRYELNLCNSHGENLGSQCGSFSNLAKPIEPRLPMAAPAGEWQSLDIEFRAPRFNTSGMRIAFARATVLLNGVVIHADVELDRLKGAAKRLGDAPDGPIMLQEHGAAYELRNIWVVERSQP